MLTIKELKELYTKMTGLVSKGDTIPEVLDEIEQAYVNPQTAIEELKNSMTNMFCFKKVYEEKGLSITEETSIDTDISRITYLGKICLIRIEDNTTPAIATVIGTYNGDGSFSEMAKNNTVIGGKVFANYSTNKMGVTIIGTELRPVKSFEIYFLENVIV